MLQSLMPLNPNHPSIHPSIRSTAYGVSERQ